MIVCPNCNHQNPDGAVQCESCYTPLPTMTKCPSCGSTVQTDASFCGQCGFNLRAAPSGNETPVPPTVSPSFDMPDMPDLMPPEPLVEPEPLVASVQSSNTEGLSNPPELGEPVAAQPESAPPLPPPTVAQIPTSPAIALDPSQPAPGAYQTQLQVQNARLLHVQTDTLIELPQNLSVVHIGKPNDRIPPDIDVSGFPDSEIVSRIHADVRVEGGIYYIEDVGSSNGTYINNSPLPMGNRHRLRSGDRIALGKGDRMTFLFQSS